LAELTKEGKEHIEKVDKNIASFKVQNRDLDGDVITNIFAKGDEYVIYSIKRDGEENETLRFYIETYDKSDPEKLIENFSMIRENLVDFRSILHMSKDRKDAMQRATHAIVTAIKGNIEESKQIFNTIITSIKEDYHERHIFKGIYLGSYILITSILALFGFIIYFFRATTFVSNNIEGLTLLIIGVAGVVGGFISVSTKLELLNFEPHTPKWQIGLHSFERASYSFVLGIIGYLLVKNGLLFAFLNENSSMYGYLLAGAMAGVSERLIPDKLVELESKS